MTGPGTLSTHSSTLGPHELLSLIGNTPLVELRHVAPESAVRIYAKLEGQNPSGSLKDRIALAMVVAAERSGKLLAGGTIVEASSGNTAIALGLVARQRGYRLKVVIPGRRSAHDRRCHEPSGC